MEYKQGMRVGLPLKPVKECSVDIYIINKFQLNTSAFIHFLRMSVGHFCTRTDLRLI
jgi:hypothetical protein